jgi:glycosyltransferase involved in cell wall biosynthesis
MNVLFVTGIFPPDIGGPATYTDEMGSELSARGHDVRVVTLSKKTDGTQDSDRPFAVTRLRRRQSIPRRVARTIFAIRSNCAWADFVFVQGLFVETGVASLFTQTPIVARVPGDTAWERARRRGWTEDSFRTFQTERYGPRIETTRRVRSWALNRMTSIITASEFFAGIVSGWGVDPDRIVQINNFVDVPETSTLPTVTLPAGGEDTVVTVGRLVDVKRIDNLIRAVAPLEEVHLLVIGDGPTRARLKGVARESGATDRVTFLGNQPHDVTLSYVQAADVFALASSVETFSIAVLEAMSVGTPVVATDCGGPGEILDDGNTGLLVPTDSPSALRSAISDIRERPALADQLRNQAAESLDEYKLSRVADEVEELLTRVSRTATTP